MVRTLANQAAAWVRRIECRISALWGSGRFEASLGHQVTRFAVAAVLLSAGSLKLWSLLEGEGAGSHSLYRAELAAVETGLATLLILRRPGWIVWTACLLLFVGFAGVSGYYAATGVPTCDCFGKIVVPPIWTLAIDLGLLAAMLAVAPAHAMAAWNRIVPIENIALGMAIGAASIGGLAAAQGAFRPSGREIAPGVIARGNSLILTPKKWVGHPIPANAVAGANESVFRSGTWEIWLLDANCTACTDAVRDHSVFLGTLLNNVADTPRRAAILAHPHSRHSPLELDGIDLVLRFRTTVECPMPTRLRCADGIVIECDS